MQDTYPPEDTAAKLSLIDFTGVQITGIAFIESGRKLLVASRFGVEVCSWHSALNGMHCT